QNVSANNPPVAFRDISMRVGPEPIRQRILARHLGIERIRVGGSNYIAKNSPDRAAIRIYRRANVDHCGNKRLSRRGMDVVPESQPFPVLSLKHKLVPSGFAAALSALSIRLRIFSTLEFIFDEQTVSQIRRRVRVGPRT